MDGWDDVDVDDDFLGFFFLVSDDESSVSDPVVEEDAHNGKIELQRWR